MQCCQCGREIPDPLPMCPICGVIIADKGPPTEAEPREGEAGAATVERLPAMSATMRAGESGTPMADVGPAQQLAASPGVALTQPATQQPSLDPMRGRIGSGIALLGSILAFISLLLPWIAVTSTSPDGTVTTTTDVGPLNLDAMGLLTGWAVLYILLVMALLLLNLAVFIQRARRMLAGAGIAQLAVSLTGLLLCGPVAIALQAVQPEEDLGGGWVGLVGFITSLIGSIWILVDCLRAPKE
uniref:Zinc-ribbon domain-containing protein n=1 Tax=Thermogemmatispora argillosa TaxID=2045280 RepID=A0A455T198_9CHLR|nr:hypothetical protein KTA_04040 [Thermogemmatispora argillosa]